MAVRKIIELAAALHSLRPEAAFSINENDYDSIEMLSDHDLPSLAELQTEQARLQALADDAHYKLERREAYPSIEDQLDRIYHDGIDAWKTDIQAVKENYPKPE